MFIKYTSDSHNWRSSRVSIQLYSFILVHIIMYNVHYTIKTCSCRSSFVVP